MVLLSEKEYQSLKEKHAQEGDQKTEKIDVDPQKQNEMKSNTPDPVTEEEEPNFMKNEYKESLIDAIDRYKKETLKSPSKRKPKEAWHKLKWTNVMNF